MERIFSLLVVFVQRVAEDDGLIQAGRDLRRSPVQTPAQGRVSCQVRSTCSRLYSVSSWKPPWMNISGPLFQCFAILRMKNIFLRYIQYFPFQFWPLLLLLCTSVMSLAASCWWPGGTGAAHSSLMPFLLQPCSFDSSQVKCSSLKHHGSSPTEFSVILHPLQLLSGCGITAGLRRC